MTNEEIDRAIAEHLGWTYLPPRVDPNGIPCSPCWVDPGCGPYVHTGHPSYSTDLNAMHEAEETLRKNQFHFVHYTRELWKLEAGDVEYGNLGYFGFNFVTMDANRRAEAFLRTIGKWRCV